MIVAWAWPGCTFQNGRWDANPVDAYFVGLTPKEVTEHVPELSLDNNISKSPDDMGKCGGCIWFLVGKDGSFCDYHAWYYPIGNQWNGYSPFVHLDPELEVGSFSELKDLPQVQTHAEQMVEDADYIEELVEAVTHERVKKRLLTLAGELRQSAKDSVGTVYG